MTSFWGELVCECMGGEGRIFLFIEEAREHKGEDSRNEKYQNYRIIYGSLGGWSAEPKE